MDLMQAFEKIMTEQKEIALATSTDNIPNVRIVNFIRNAEKRGVLYFSTFKGNQKEKEFARNNQVAFTTIPHSGSEHVRAGNATVKTSGSNIYDLKEAFEKKIPDYAEIIQQAGDQLVVYEIHFSGVCVTIDFNQSGTIDV